MIADILHVDLDTCASLHTTLYAHIRGNLQYLLLWINWMYHNKHLEWDTTKNLWHLAQILKSQDGDLTARTSLG
jgi:hypothetical protein